MITAPINQTANAGAPVQASAIPSSTKQSTVIFDHAPDRDKKFHWTIPLVLLIAPPLAWGALTFTQPVSLPTLLRIQFTLQAATATFAALIFLASWESFQVERFFARFVLAVAFGNVALLATCRLLFFDGLSAPLKLHASFQVIDLAIITHLLVTGALAFMAFWPNKRLHRLQVKPMVLAAALALTVITGAALFAYHQFVSTFVFIAAALPPLGIATAVGLYVLGIIAAWRGRESVSGYSGANLIPAMVLLLCSVLFLAATQLWTPQTILLADAYRLAGFALILHYVFIIGLREPYRRLSASQRHLQDNMAAQRRMERAVAESEQRFRQLFEKSPAMMLLIDAADGKITDANEAAVKFYGWSRSHFQNMHIWDVNTLPRQELVKILSDVAVGDENHFVFQYRLAQGKVRDVEVCSVCLDFQGRKIIFSISYDVTARKLAEDNLRLFKQAVESTMDGICIVIAEASVPNPSIIYVNPAFEKLTGYKLEDIKGKNPRFLHGPQHNQPGHAIIRDALRNGHACETVLLDYRKDGTSFWVNLHLAPVCNQRGTITHWVSVESDITRQKQNESELEQLAFYDPLTELPNRRLFMDRLTQALATSRRTGQHGAVVFMDVNRFKNINDVCGHEVGDHLLIKLAKRLAHCQRGEDTIARLGGDEFVLLLSNLSSDPNTTTALASTVTERIRKAVCDPIKIGDYEHEISLSMGVTIFPKGADSVSDLLKQADAAMYKAKDSGDNSTGYFEPAMQAAAQVRMSVEHDLREALVRQDFRMFLQPQVDQNGTIVGAEALIRWRNKEGGLISPMTFISVAEDTGLIIPMDTWMLEQACLAIRRLEVAGSNIRVAANISARHFRVTDFVDRVKTAVEASAIDPDHLTLEITESVFLNDPEDAVSKMNQLRHTGLHFSIDDFGTGYSSLGYLKKMPLSELKIDRTFIQDAPTDPNDAALVEAILAVAHHHDLSVVAEGVETVEQVEFLKVRGCLIFQGYYFGRPVPAEEFLSQLISGSTPAVAHSV
ncbi:MAG: EAL domain-containing protein [Phycisphaerae bacterium]